jgi:hypothetical protein
LLALPQLLVLVLLLPHLYLLLLLPLQRRCLHHCCCCCRCCISLLFLYFLFFFFFFFLLGGGGPSREWIAAPPLALRLRQEVTIIETTLRDGAVLAYNACHFPDLCCDFDRSDYLLVHNTLPGLC